MCRKTRQKGRKTAPKGACWCEKRKNALSPKTDSRDFSGKAGIRIFINLIVYCPKFGVKRSEGWEAKIGGGMRSEYVYAVERRIAWGELARAFGYHPQLLWRQNPGAKRLMEQGERLRLPYRGCARGIFYTVGAAQSLADIAGSLGIRLEELLQYNPALRAEAGRAGQVILLPGTEAAYRLARVRQQRARGGTLYEYLQGAGMSLELLELLNPGRDILQPLPRRDFWVIDWKNRS